MTKFSDATAEILYALSEEGSWLTDDVSDQQYGGAWYGLFTTQIKTVSIADLEDCFSEISREMTLAIPYIRRQAGAILVEDQQGFVNYQLYHDKEELYNKWEKIVEDVGSEEDDD